jgi:hypothetical protein
MPALLVRCEDCPSGPYHKKPSDRNNPKILFNLARTLGRCEQDAHWQISDMLDLVSSMRKQFEINKKVLTAQAAIVQHALS